MKPHTLLAISLAAGLIAGAQRCVHGQSPNGPVEIVLIGTVHEPTANFREEILRSILARVKPDLILLELDPIFFDKTLTLPAKYEGITLETRAATTYAKTASVKLRPYDIEGRNKFYQEHDYFAQEQKLNQEVSRLYSAGQLSAEAKLLVEALRATAAIRDACGAERVEVFNSNACDVAIEQKQYYAFKGLGKIIALTPALADMSAFWTSADEFWTRRNAEMVRNIATQTKELGAKRVVVLAGYEHRYNLKKQLAASGVEAGFIVKGFQDY
jgi:hypothetical protein